MSVAFSDSKGLVWGRNGMEDHLPALSYQSLRNKLMEWEVTPPPTPSSQSLWNRMMEWENIPPTLSPRSLWNRLKNGRSSQHKDSNLCETGWWNGRTYLQHPVPISVRQADGMGHNPQHPVFNLCETGWWNGRTSLQHTVSNLWETGWWNGRSSLQHPVSNLCETGWWNGRSSLQHQVLNLCETGWWNGRSSPQAPSLQSLWNRLVEWEIISPNTQSPISVKQAGGMGDHPLTPSSQSLWNRLVEWQIIPPPHLTPRSQFLSNRLIKWEITLQHPVPNLCDTCWWMSQYHLCETGSLNGGSSLQHPVQSRITVKQPDDSSVQGSVRGGNATGDLSAITRFSSSSPLYMRIYAPPQLWPLNPVGQRHV